MKEKLHSLQSENLQSVPQINQVVDNRKNPALPMPVPDSLQMNQVSKLVTTILFRNAMHVT